MASSCKLERVDNPAHARLRSDARPSCSYATLRAVLDTLLANRLPDV
jgi:hypothetical protein